jgi:hypothetical protein
MIRAALAGAAVMMATAIPVAHAFNTYNGTNFPICVWSNDQHGYFEEVGPHLTSRGWAINKSMTLHVSVMDAEYCSDHGGCINSCNNDMSSSCTVQPHHQQYVSEILFGGKAHSSSENQFAYLAGDAAEFNMDCNQ